MSCLVLAGITVIHVVCGEIHHGVVFSPLLSEHVSHIKFYLLPDDKNFRLVQIETNCRQHVKVCLN